MKNNPFSLYYPCKEEDILCFFLGGVLPKQTWRFIGTYYPKYKSIITYLDEGT